MWVTKLLISPVNKRIFCPKTIKFGPKLAFLVNLGQAMQAYSVPRWLVNWWLWRAGCISQDTYLLYTIQNWHFRCVIQVAFQMYSTFSKNLASFLQVEQTCFPVCRFSLEVDFFFCALQRPTLLFIGDPLLCSTLLTFSVTFVLTNTERSALPGRLDWSCCS